LLDNGGYQTQNVGRVTDRNGQKVEESEDASNDQGEREVKDVANELVYLEELLFLIARHYQKG
jgi:hypothetical protein